MYLIPHRRAALVLLSHPVQADWYKQLWGISVEFSSRIFKHYKPVTQGVSTCF
jgi:hypothetical protein